MSKLTIGIMLLTAMGGCAKSSAGVDVHGAREAGRFRLTKEPSDTVCVRDVRKILPADGEVAVLGRIGGIDNPWTFGEASFVICDPSYVDPTQIDHDCGDNCPYCEEESAAQMDSMAFVQIIDDHGRVVRIDARELLGVEEDQTVVVRGTASLNRSGHIVIAAKGLYVRE